MLYGVTKLGSSTDPGVFTKGLFWGSLLTALMTTISAVGLGADTQIKFRKLNPKQQDERRKATYALAAVALITAGIAAALGIKYSGGEGGNPLWKFNGPDLSEENVKKAASLSGIMLITGSGVTGLGLAIDKGMNGKKRNPAAQKKRDIAMGVLLAISGVALLSGAAYKKQDAIKGAFDDPYATVRTALTKTNYTLEDGDTMKNAQVAGALNAIRNLQLGNKHPLTNAIGKIPEGATTNTIFSTINTQLKQLTLKGRAGAALGAAGTAVGAGLTTTAGLFKTGESYSKTRVGSAVLLLASIIILAVLKSQKKLKPAPKPGKPGKPAPSKVPPGEIVMYVMIGLSVLIFTGSLVKDKLFSSAPAAAPEAPAPEAPAPDGSEAPEAGGGKKTVGERFAGLFKKAAPDYTAVRAALGANNTVANKAALKTAVDALPRGDPIKAQYERLININTGELKNNLSMLRGALPLVRQQLP
jgi:hypothetical protein